MAGRGANTGSNGRPKPVSDLIDNTPANVDRFGG
jgi:hypothetical protein